MKVIDGVKERFVAVTIGGNVPIDLTFTLVLMPSGQPDEYDSGHIMICDKNNTM